MAGTSEGTRRGMAARLAEGDAIARRVRDCLMDMGHGNLDAGRERFVDHAIWCARQHGLRLWSDTNQTLRDGGLNSLSTPLGERNTSTGRRSTNERWVFAIWTAACDDWFRVNPAKPKVPVPDPALEQLEATSPAATDAMVNPPPRRLSARILDAYLNRDSDAMLLALGELEEQGL